MKTKLTILASLLLLNLVSFSQTDTSKVCLSYKIAQQIAQDLIQGDACKIQLGHTQSMVESLEAKSVIKDSIIQTYVEKDTLQAREIRAKDKVITLTEKKCEGLQKEVKKLNRIKKVLSYVTAVTSTVAVLSLLILL